MDEGEINMKTITIRTAKRNDMVDITQEVQQYITESQVKEGTVFLFVPHTTAAVTINENADPDVVHDMLLGLHQISPSLRGFQHMEGNSDAHIKSSLVGVDQTILFQNNRLVLGTWQGIYFCEFDGPRTRQLHMLIQPNH
jgi:secondary thiamine-phosphate synthase enzyme